MDRPIYFRPIIALTLAQGLGIVIAGRTEGSSLWAYAVICACLAWLIWRIGREKGSVLVPLALFFFIGWVSIKSYLAPILPSDHIANFLNERPQKITGTIDSEAIPYAFGARYDLRVEAVGQRHASGKIRLTVLGGARFLSAGDRVTFTGRLRPIRGSINPGGFDYARYMRIHRMWGAGYVKQELINILEKNPSAREWKGLETFRRKLVGRIENSVSGQPAQVLKALVVGEREGISAPVREAFNRSGAAHALAVSGLHVGMVAGSAMAFFCWALSYVPWLTAGGRVRKVAAVLTSIFVVAYGILTGMSPATQRAVIMALVFLLGFLAQKEHDLINTVFIAALLILIVYPPALFSISFQLSFAAAIGIITGFSMIAAGEGRETRWVIQAFKTSVWASIFAIGATLPLVMHYFNQISWVGVISNLLVIPLLGCWVLPLALGGAWMELFSPAVAGFFLKLAGFGTDLMLNIVVWIGSVSWAAVKTITPSWLEISAYYGIAGCAMHWIQRQRRTGLNPESQNDFRIQMAAALCALVLAADAGYWVYERWFSDRLRVTVLDVGQGSSTLIEMPRGYCILVDGGGADNRVFDVGEKIVAPYLWRKKIHTIDLMVLSHPDSDHVNGLVFVARHFNVKQLWTNGQGVNSNACRELMNIAREKRIDLPAFEAIQRHVRIHGASLNVLHPPLDFKPQREDDQNVNDHSIVLKLQHGQTSFLLPGDITRNTEKRLVDAAGEGLRSLVLLSPHHGSATSSSDHFLRSVAPEIVIVSAGWRNRFGFPHSSVMERYQRYNAQVFQTAVHGAVYLVSDGERLAVRPTLR